ncbi:hypothetical protein HKX42_02550 [Salinisphaera sp. USBA-960]|uniref:pilus assembly PilX family protein n=1 Tax=Salinisphaera orenii TaxID=856731 RepID=UPI000DBE172B|nr:hypothetical protein [Salifodinibacter halophilus]NNC25756.1 hypothetical protein [Salifodinibacter halophilus]
MHATKVSTIPSITRTHDEDGFILITSLLFLVIITLLALSSINSSTLQQKMATNTNAKAASRQTANNALRYSESVLGATPGYPTPNSHCYKLKANGVVIQTTSCGDAAIDVAPQPKKSLAPSKWIDGTAYPNAAQPYSTGGTSPTHTDYWVTYQQASSVELSQTAQANGGGIYFFTTTARTQGPGSQTTTVTQSVFKKQYGHR